VRPAVAGVTNLLGSVAREKANPASSLKRVILTSSTGMTFGISRGGNPRFTQALGDVLAGAIYGVGAKPRSGTLFTEADWNDVSSLEVLPYYYSKVRLLVHLFTFAFLETVA
jgi:hypothetical protein